MSYLDPYVCVVYNMWCVLHNVSEAVALFVKIGDYVVSVQIRYHWIREGTIHFSAPTNQPTSYSSSSGGYSIKFGIGDINR